VTTSVLPTPSDTPDSPLPTPGSLKSFMSELVALERTVHDDLRVYRWRPIGVPELPALYNWMPTSTFVQKDLARWADNPRVLVRIAIAHSEIDEDMASLEDYADHFRAVTDAEFQHGNPLNGTCRRAERVGMNTVLDRFNDIDLLCIEFPIQAEIHRRP